MSENSEHTTAPIASLDSDDMACSTYRVSSACPKISH
jgi:hypothetical protein